MTMLTDQLKTQLLDLAETINSFQSEAIQIKIADKMLGYIFTDIDKQFEQQEMEAKEATLSARRAKRTPRDKNAPDYQPRERKPTGATRAMHLLLDTDFFNQPQTIADVANKYREEFKEDFKTSEISGILLKTVKDNMLRREKNMNNKRYEYVKA